MEYFKLILPVLMVTACYLMLRYLPGKDSKRDIFIKFRILTGSVGSGFFLCLSLNADTIKDGILPAALSLIVFYGVIMLQNKYLAFKK